MRFRTATRETAAEPTTASADESNSGSGFVRWLLVLGIAIVAVAYAVSRYVDEDAVQPAVEEASERIPALEAIRERTADAVPDESQEIPIGGQGESGSTADEESTSSSDADEISDAETNVDVTDEERSPSEIEERASEEMAEPGEMAIDDDVADVLDEAEAGDEESDTGEAGESSEEGET